MQPAALVATARARAARPFAYPAFRRLWAGAVIEAFSNWMERLAVGWLVLDVTGSVFLGALSFAVRAAPNMLLGPFGGAVADRFERRRVLTAVALTKAGALAGIAALVLAGVQPIWPVLVLVALGGAVRTAEVPAMQALLGDIAGRDGAANVVGMYSLGVRMVGVVGALSGGLIIESAGAGPAFLLGSVLLLVAARLYAGVRVPRENASGRGSTSLWADAVAGLALVPRVPAVATLLALAVLVEVFAFSYQSLLPAVAERILGVGAAGLGALTFAAGLGAMLGAGALSVLGSEARPGRLMLAVTAGFGVLLVAFSASTDFRLSLALIVGVGAMAAMFDALQWILLQAAVPDEMRGRVIGGWMAAIGFGWMGPVMLGGVAEAATTAWAIALSGALVVVLAACAAFSPVRRL